MAPRIFALLLFCAVGGLAQQQEGAQQPQIPASLDVLFLRNGRTVEGKISGLEGGYFRLKREVVPGQPPATISVPRLEVASVEFARDEEMERFFENAAGGDIVAAARYWGAHEKYLSIPRSPAAATGIRYADLLVRSGNPSVRERALDLYRQIEAEAWRAEDRASARRGRLRAMIATGRAAEAVKEAEELAETSEDPAVLIEAKLILAAAAAAELRSLEKEHPRWQEDIFVRPERMRLYHRALDLFLFPYLFYGSEIEPSARGLWGAAEIYRDGGDLPSARETARDLAAIYPGTPYAAQAEALLASLPEAITNEDYETNARHTIE